MRKNIDFFTALCYNVLNKIKKGLPTMNNSAINKSVFDELVNGFLNIIPSGIVSIILYGSAARGTAETDSDVDIAIILNRPFSYDENDKLSDFIVDMDLKYDKVFSVIDVDGENYLKWQDIIPFYQNVKKEGVVLWKSA